MNRNFRIAIGRDLSVPNAGHHRIRPEVPIAFWGATANHLGRSHLDPRRRASLRGFYPGRLTLYQ